MIRTEARDYINAKMSVELEVAPKQSGGYDTYVCPFCGNGSGENGTGIATKDGKNYKCFRGDCDFYGDYLEILKRKHGTDSETDIFNLYGLTIDDGETRPSETATPEFKPKQDVDTVDYTHYCISANLYLKGNQSALSYLKRRGISEATAERFNLGYVVEWKHPTAASGIENPRIIIPTGKGSYLARAMNTDTPANKKVMAVGQNNIFNAEALRGATPVFVAEGAFDALSIMEVGGTAIALGGTSKVNKLLEICKENPPTVPLFLALDNDTAGKNAQEKLAAGLTELNIPFYEVNISGEHKDPNAHLALDREAFTTLVNSDLVETARLEAEAKKEKYLATSAANQLTAFTEAVYTNNPPIPTGFSKLDEALDGGLHAGELTIIGAISSLGKTTFVLQAADQIAKAGYDVMIFSLEMSSFELMAKSISRLTLKIDRTLAKTSRDILNGEKRASINDSEREHIAESITAYAEYSNRIFIHEGIGNIGVEKIKQEVQKHISYTGNTPVVIIDYLQIISPASDMKRSTDKQITDHNVLELKRLCRDKKIPVIAVSSFNRDNYNTVVNFGSFKESGAIEYSSDVLLGLQLAGVEKLSQSDGKKGDTVSEIEELKKANPRRVLLKVLKNRNGRIGANILYKYYPMHNCFIEPKDPSEYMDMNTPKITSSKSKR